MSLILIRHQDCLLHEMGPMHSECPGRLITILNEINKIGLNQFITIADALPASDESIELIHPVDFDVHRGNGTESIYQHHDIANPKIVY